MPKGNSREYITGSIKGTQREENKDRSLIIETPEYTLAMLFDGISSAEEANKGIDVACDFIKKEHGKFISSEKVNLSSLMFGAHSQILHANLKSPYTTYCAAYFPRLSTSTKLSSMGDSRIYAVNPQYIRQLSQDDNLVHSKNVVTRYLGMIDLTQEGFREFSLDLRQDKLLLCSDGFYSLMEQNLARFHQILNFDRLANVQKSLRDEVENKNKDDATYVLIS